MKKSVRVGILLSLSFCFSSYAHAQIITTYAGDNSLTFAGDGGPATDAKFNLTSGVAIDATGNVYVADQGNNRIRKINTAGVVSTIAGTGIPFYGGDGGPATSAFLSSPSGVTLDAAGNIYIADYGNSRIRKIDIAGMISTVAGNGTAGFGGDGSAATMAKINQPTCVAVDATGNLFIADLTNQRIRKVNSSGIIATIAGNGTSGYGGDSGPATAAMLHQPSGVAIDAAGNIYIADQLNARIRKINAAGVISTIAGTGTSGFSGDGGPATAAKLYQPSGLCLDGSGNIFVADMANNRVRKISTTGTITTVSGTSTGGFSGDGTAATAAQLFSPFTVTIDAGGNLFIADETNNRIRKTSTAGIINTIAGSGLIAFGDGGPASAAQLSRPKEMVVDVSGNLYLLDYGHNKIRKITPAGIISTVAGNGTAGYNGDGIPATNASLGRPTGFAIDIAGNIYIADPNNQRIRKVDTFGIITTICGIGLSGSSGDGGPASSARVSDPQSVITDAAGNIYFTDNTYLIRKINTAGIVTKFAGTYGAFGYAGDGGPATACKLWDVLGLKTDNLGNLFLADFSNHVIRKINAAGIISTVAGTGVPGFSGDGGPATAAQLKRCINVSIDALHNIIISEYQNHRIRKVSPSGIITTIAGDGSAAYSGDGGPATAASLNYPSGTCLDSYGNLYIADNNNDVIRKVSGSPTLGVVSLSRTQAQIFPNPTKGRIEVTSIETITNLKVYNLLGMQVHEQACNGLTANADISNLPAGVYLLKVNDAEVYKVEKD